MDATSEEVTFVRRHLEAAEVVLAAQPTANASHAETLRGLARAWDRIETTGEGIGNVPAIAAQILRTLEVLAVPDAGDVFDEVLDAILDAG